MRSIKLTGAFAAAALSLALIPLSAAALPHPKPQIEGGGPSSSKCHIGLLAEPHAVTSGDEAVDLFGQLGCRGGLSLASRTVTIYERPAGTMMFKALGNATTEAGGFYALPLASLTVNTTFEARIGALHSGTRTVKVSPQVTLAGPADGADLRTGPHNRVTFTGTITPADVGATLSLQRENATSSEEWHVIQHGVITPGDCGALSCTYSITHQFAVPGDANIRVVVHPPRDTFTIRGFSNTLSYEISQAQNPRLTIHSSTDPVSFGAPITITGILAGGADKPVMLLGHPRGSTVFTPIPTPATMTNGAGEYTFVVPSALENTFYRVTGTGISSAVLFEGVKYVLTAGVSATKIQAGQVLTFSGTVAPDHVGHVVYLERQNILGGGFHVVDVGTVTSIGTPATGTYTIPYTVFGSGMQVYRIKIPGDPENQATSSAPFTIEVQPAAATVFRPLPPPIEPIEGQI